MNRVAHGGSLSRYVASATNPVRSELMAQQTSPCKGWSPPRLAVRPCRRGSSMLHGRRRLPVRVLPCCCGRPVRLLRERGSVAQAVDVKLGGSHAHGSDRELGFVCFIIVHRCSPAQRCSPVSQAAPCPPSWPPSRDVAWHVPSHTTSGNQRALGEHGHGRGGRGAAAVGSAVVAAWLLVLRAMPRGRSFDLFGGEVYGRDSLARQPAHLHGRRTSTEQGCSTVRLRRQMGELLIRCCRCSAV